MSSPFKHLTKEDLERIRTCLYREIGEYLSHDCEAAAARCIDTVRNLEREVEDMERYRSWEVEERERNRVVVKTLCMPMSYRVFAEDADE